MSARLGGLGEFACHVRRNMCCALRSRRAFVFPWGSYFALAGSHWSSKEACCHQRRLEDMALGPGVRGQTWLVGCERHVSRESSIVNVSGRPGDRLTYIIGVVIGVIVQWSTEPPCAERRAIAIGLVMRLLQPSEAFAQEPHPTLASGGRARYPLACTAFSSVSGVPPQSPTRVPSHILIAGERC